MANFQPLIGAVGGVNKGGLYSNANTHRPGERSEAIIADD